MAIKYEMRRGLSFWSGEFLLFGNIMCCFLQASHTHTHTYA